MSRTALRANARDLERELEWLEQILDRRFRLYFTDPGEEPSSGEPEAPPPPDLEGSDSPYARSIRDHRFSATERLALALALVPHIRPRLLDVFFVRNRTYDRPFTEFGGVYWGPRGDFHPTGATLAFVLGGEDLETRFDVQRLFDSDHAFARHHLLSLVRDEHHPHQLLAGRLRLSPDFVSAWTAGHTYRPDFGNEFPARRITTTLEWDDLVLHPSTRQQILEIEHFLEHGATLMDDWGLAAKLRPGHRSLFYGPPGTGKTLTACLLGKATGRDVYRVDLSLVVSKYIGETEKNLARIFDAAEHKSWILFFDEADALFGKRGEAKDAQTRYANQEVSFLLQRIEIFDGVAVLASNLRDNLDPAFARRFESIIYFPMPGPEERLRLWRQGFSPRTELASDLDLETIARRHSLSGGAIMNAIRHASMQVLASGGQVLHTDQLEHSIQHEHNKEGRAL